MISAIVKLWGKQIGAVVQDDFGKIRFNYTDDFIDMGIKDEDFGAVERLLYTGKRISEYSDFTIFI